MADNTTTGTGVPVATDEVTYSGDASKHVQLMRSVFVTGAEGSKTVVDPAKSGDLAGATGTTVQDNTQAVGLGPGWTRRADPSNLGTAANSTSTIDVNGCEIIGFEIGTSTTGTYIVEGNADAGTTWKPIFGLNINASVPLNIFNTALTPTSGDILLIPCAGLRQVRLRTVTTLGATMAHKWTGAVGNLPPGAFAPAPHNFGYAETGVSAQYTTTQTSTVIGPTVSSSQRLVVTYVQIDGGGTVTGNVQVYFGTGAFSRGSSKPIFDGGLKPSSSSEPGFVASKPNGWIGAADEELRVTDSAAINPLTVTIWYYLIPA